MTRVLDAYRWAPPLHGQTIRVPFKFRAPNGQNTIDRALVPWNGQGKLSVAVLLDATVIRMVLVPAFMQAMGRWNWWPGVGAEGPVKRRARGTPVA